MYFTCVETGGNEVILLVLHGTLHEVFSAPKWILSVAFQLPTLSIKKKWEQSIMVMHAHFSFLNYLKMYFNYN